MAFAIERDYPYIGITLDVSVILRHSLLPACEVAEPAILDQFIASPRIWRATSISAQLWRTWTEGYRQ